VTVKQRGIKERDVMRAIMLSLREHDYTDTETVAVLNSVREYAELRELSVAQQVIGSLKRYL
jgi:hypothetical protein